MLQNFNVDKTIISCKGIHIEKGVTESNEMELEIKKAMIASAKKIILAVDGSKFNKVSFARLTDIKIFDVIVTDKLDDKAWLEYFKLNNMVLI